VVGHVDAGVAALALDAFDVYTGLVGFDNPVVFSGIKCVAIIQAEFIDEGLVAVGHGVLGDLITLIVGKKIAFLVIEEFGFGQESHKGRGNVNM
jgi:hypothetical protein